jgi:Protein of unknown function (DUF3040)
MGGTVPLSEHEQRQLEQIEQALYADHPRLARAMRAKDPKVHYGRKVRQASLGFLVGVGVLAAGIFLKYDWLAVAGFVVMLLSAGWAVASYRRRAAIAITDRKRGRSHRQRGRAARQPANSGLMERLEERWRRRQEGNGRR